MKTKTTKILCFTFVLSLLLSAFCVFGTGCDNHTHTWSNGELTKVATDTEQGKITYTCINCKEKKSKTIEAGTKITTRADLEEAVVDAAWAYYMKKEAIQYDSIELSMVSKTSGGLYRHSDEVSPEYGTSDTTIFNVCSTFVSAAYLEGIGRYIFEGKYTPSGLYTSMLWACADNQPEEGYFPTTASVPDKKTANDKDAAVLRWVDCIKYPQIEASSMDYYNNMSVNKSSAFTDWYKEGKLQYKYNKTEQIYDYYLNGEWIYEGDVKDLVRDYINKKVDGEYVNLRPGDIFVDEDHAVIYVGNGVVLDCYGTKYNTTTGTDRVETNAVYGRISSVTDELKSAKSNFALVRPIDFYAQDFDGDKGNDVVMYNGEMLDVPESTKSRIKYPAMDINRTVDATPYGAVSQGDNLTYRIAITNNTMDEKYASWRKLALNTGIDYANLKVTEKIPAGTQLVSATGNYQLDNGVLTWIVNVPAQTNQNCVELSYTVKAIGQVGSMIVNDGGFVDNIPSNSISNVIGKKKLDNTQMEILTTLANAENTNGWSAYGSGLDFAENIYKAMNVNLELPSIENIIQNLFTPTYMEIPKLSIYYGEVINATMYRLQKTVASDFVTTKQMLVNGFYGGYRSYFIDIEKFKDVGIDNFDFEKECNNSILDPRLNFLEIGDIIVYATAKNRGATTLTSQVSEYTILIYAGNNTLLRAKTNLDSTTEYSILKGDLAKAELVSCFKNTNDLFFNLRPSQVMNLSN